MGIAFSMIEKLEQLGLFGAGKASILDVGSSNLYSATADGILDFLKARGIPRSIEIDDFAQRLAKGSAYDPVGGGLNEAFAGELYERAGMRYAAIDIADGYRTTILDLNHDSTPAEFKEAFDIVLNFGTTEHLLNQLNAFKVIHDSTKQGGYIVHSLPAIGYTNHGYFTYTPRFFFDLAGYNEYEVIGFRYEGPSGANDLYAPVNDYKSYFPQLTQTLKERDQTNEGRTLSGLKIPDVGIVCIYRKTKSRPFAGALEKSTSVGRVPGGVEATYQGASGAGSVISTTSRGIFPGLLFSWLRRTASRIKRLLFTI